MAHRVPYSQKLHVEQAYNAKLSIADFMIVGAVSGASFILGYFFFSPIIWPIFGAASLIIAYLFVSPSGEPGKKNYQKVYIILFKKRTVYHAINRPQERWWR